MTQAYPLQWPRHRARRPAEDRKRGRFSSKNGHGVVTEVSLPVALTRLFEGLTQIGGAEGAIVSSNLEVRRDGLPRSGQRTPSDPGICVYFELAGKPRAMPCDTYDSVEANIAAVSNHIQATRVIERHGVATVSEMFEGFTALPAPGARKPWWEVLGVRSDAAPAEIEAAFKAKAKVAHPDMGGSADAMAEINRARHEALG